MRIDITETNIDEAINDFVEEVAEAFINKTKLKKMLVVTDQAGNDMLMTGIAHAIADQGLNGKSNSCKDLLLIEMKQGARFAFIDI